MDIGIAGIRVGFVKRPSQLFRRGGEEVNTQFITEIQQRRIAVVVIVAGAELRTNILRFQIV